MNENKPITPPPATNPRAILSLAGAQQPAYLRRLPPKYLPKLRSFVPIGGIRKPNNAGYSICRATCALSQLVAKAKALHLVKDQQFLCEKEPTQNAIGRPRIDGRNQSTFDDSKSDSFASNRQCVSRGVGVNPINLNDCDCLGHTGYFWTHAWLRFRFVKRKNASARASLL